LPAPVRAKVATMPFSTPITCMRTRWVFYPWWTQCGRRKCPI
jgi:hypothetical protein